MSKRIPGQMVEGYRSPVYNEHEVRAAAGITLAAAVVAFCIALFDQQKVPLTIVSTFFFVEFIVRVFVGFQYSPTGLITRAFLRRREPQWVSAKPKRFAWSMGMGISGVMTYITNAEVPGWIVPRTLCAICITLMWLEAAWGVCVGCQMYAYGVRRGWIAKDEEIEVCAGGVCDIPEPASRRLERPDVVRPARVRPLVAEGRIAS